MNGNVMDIVTKLVVGLVTVKLLQLLVMRMACTHDNVGIPIGSFDPKRKGHFIRGRDNLGNNPMSRPKHRTTFLARQLQRQADKGGFGTERCLHELFGTTVLRKIDGGICTAEMQLGVLCAGASIFALVAEACRSTMLWCCLSCKNSQGVMRMPAHTRGPIRCPN